jgi:glycosyltransferase involved in cell wall biosynthesis
MPAISVIVPCYNGGKFLDQLTASLARQTFRDFETIIVNDGSTDPATLAKLAALGPEIRVVTQENRGLSAARNAGFAAASADLVMVLDCDDQLEPAYLAETLGALRAAGPAAGFAFTHVRLTGAGSGTQARYANAFDILFKNTIGYSMLVHKAAWRAAGQYDESMRDGYEDWEFNLRLIHAGFPGVLVPQPLFLYTASTQGMLLGHSSSRHAAVWRRIRQKHRALYRAASLLRLYRAHGAASRLSSVRLVAQLTLASLVPDAWHSRIMSLVRRWRMARTKVADEAARNDAARPRAGAAS